MVELLPFNERPPAVVMFLIGRRALCYLLCAMHSLMAAYIGYIALRIYFDVLPPYHYLMKGLGFVQGIFVVLSLALFAVYLVVGIIRWVIRRLKSALKN